VLEKMRHVSWKTTLIGWGGAVAVLFNKPTVKEAIIALFMAILGTFAKDSSRPNDTNN